MALIDTHCHLQMDKYATDRAEVIQRALDQGIGMICIGTTVADSLEGVQLAEQYPGQPVYAAVGIHPTDDDLEGIHPVQLAALLGSKKVVALGETGLDYYHESETDARSLQADVFEQHILLAGQQNLPLIIHCRDTIGGYEAYDDVLALLTRHRVSNFVMHCFSGTWVYAQKFLDLGGYLSFTGIISFPKSEALQEVVKNMPLEKIMIETDAPFLTPDPHRGQRNEPAYVAFVAQAVAKIRNMMPEEIAATTTANATKFFRLV